MTVLFFIMPVQYHCTVCKMCPDIQKHSKKNVRILFIVKSEFPGDNVDNAWKGILKADKSDGAEATTYPECRRNFLHNID